MLNAKLCKHTFKYVFLCLTVGVIFAGIGFLSRLKACFLADTYPKDLSLLEWLWIVINFPARLIFRLWVVGLRFPPQNDVLVVLMLPTIAILVQWVFVGFLVGLWINRPKSETQ